MLWLEYQPDFAHWVGAQHPPAPVSGRIARISLLEGAAA